MPPRLPRRLPALVAGLLLVSGLAPVTDLVPGARAAAPSAMVGPADPPPVWTEVTDAPRRRSADGLDQRVAPTSYAAYELDLGGLTARLGRAPAEGARGAAPVRIEVPAPTGELVSFDVVESPVMEDGLAAQHPDIRTWAGSATGGAPASIRLDVTPMGFHASVRGAGGTWYVDPAYQGLGQGADALYLSYLDQDLPARSTPFVEGVLPDADEAAAELRERLGDAPRIGEGGGAVAVQRTYRLALVSDPSYAAFFTSSADPGVVDTVVTAEKVTLMNRVNQIYGDDFSVRMLLVAGNDALNFNTSTQFLGSNGRCGNQPCYTSADIGCGDVIDTNRFVVGQVIGADDYDIGHIVFGPDGSGGGVAYLGSVGRSVKAGGCTGLDPPTGDGFAVDYVAHEMGHQFAGNHTFNGTTGSCAGGNRNAGTSVEPGSGTSIMAYAGICGIDNLQSHSDPYFSQRSQTEVAAFIRSSPGSLQELQNIALSGFTSAGESFGISYGGATSTVTAGTNYTAAGLKAALEAAEPSSATATVVGSRGTSFGTGVDGFQVTWSGTADIPTPTVTPVSGTFTSIVGTYDNGGPDERNGFQNPTPTGNRNPTVTAPAAKTIPIRTPFTLTGSATDPDGDPLVYSWEQNDTATTGTTLSSNTKLSGPLFRIFGTYAAVSAAGSTQTPSPGINVAGADPTRSFPDAAQVAAGQTNAASGSCPSLTGTGTSATAALDCMSEFLPTAARSLSFRLTARDLGGADGGPDGGTSFADVALTVGLAGPFLVTSQPSAATVAGDSTGTVSWNVASTNTATYATAVKISFSTDGGLTFPTVLAASTPNDGTESITWPNVATTQGRIKVEAVGNYFYDVTDGNLTVEPVAPPEPTLTTGGNAAGATFNATHSDPLVGTPIISAQASSVAGEAISMSATGLPAGLELSRNTTSAPDVRPGTTTFEVVGTADVDPGSYSVTVTVSDGAGGAPDATVPFTVAVTKDTATLTYTGDTSGTTGTRTVSTSVVDGDATPGTVAGSVAFTDQSTGNALCTATVVAGAASCTFAVPTARTYQVVGTLSSARYAGASAPSALTVTAPPEPTLTTGGNAAGATFDAAHSDPLIGTPIVSAEASSVAGSAISMSATGLPAGLELSRGTSSAPDVRPGTTTFEVVGTADVDPGSYPATVTVSDGVGGAPDATVSFTVAVTQDAATLTYAGDGAGTGGATTVAVDVVDDDTSPGTVSGTVAFTDQTTGDALCTAVVDGDEASCSFNAPATRTYQVVGTLSSVRYTGASSAAPLAVVVTTPVDTTPPETTITAGPAADSFVLARDVRLSYASESGATFTCSLNGASSTCPASGAVMARSLPSGSYDFAVTATDTAGNTDPTPATRRFHVPVNDRQLAATKGNWKRRAAPDAYRGSFSVARRPGATLSFRVRDATSLALVVGTGARRGRVDVFLGRTRLRTVATRGPARTRVLVGVASFGTPRSGVVRIVARDRREVRVEGLAVRTAPLG